MKIEMRGQWKEAAQVSSKDSPKEKREEQSSMRPVKRPANMNADTVYLLMTA